MMSNFLYRLRANQIFILFASLLIIVPLFLLCYYVYPSADDFSYAVMYDEMSFFEKQKEIYMTWSSRYFATFILSISFLNFGTIYYYGLYSVLGIVLFYFSLSKFLKKSFHSESFNSNYLSLLLLCVFTLFVPSICDNFYWFPSLVTYFLPSSLLLFFFANSLSSYRTNTSYTTFVLFILLVIIGGCNELLIGCAFLWLLVLILCYYYENKAIHSTFLFLICVSVLLMSFIFFAPGNEVRSEVIKSIHTISLTEVFELTVYRMSVLYVKYLVWIFLIFLFVNAYFNIKCMLKIKINLFVIFAFFNVFMLFCIFITIHSLQNVYPIRVENLFYFLSFVFLFYFANAMASKYSLSKYKRLIIIPVFGFLIVIFAPFFIKNYSNNFHLIYSDIFSGKLANYKKEYLDRDAYLKSVSNENKKKVCKIPKFNDSPKSVAFEDIQMDSNHFINQSIAKYYGVHSIAVKE